MGGKNRRVRMRKVCSVTVDKSIPESVGQTVWAHQLTFVVDVEHVEHGTKPHVSYNPVSGIHPRGGLCHEAPNLVRRALRAIVKVLASIFSNQDWEMELVMELVLIRDEVGGRNIVVMCSDRINGTSNALAKNS